MQTAVAGNAKRISATHPNLSENARHTLQPNLLLYIHFCNRDVSLFISKNKFIVWFYPTFDIVFKSVLYHEERKFKNKQNLKKPISEPCSDGISLRNVQRHNTHAKFTQWARLLQHDFHMLHLGRGKDFLFCHFLHPFSLVTPLPLPWWVQGRDGCGHRSSQPGAGAASQSWTCQGRKELCRSLSLSRQGHLQQWHSTVPRWVWDVPLFQCKNVLPHGEMTFLVL